MERSFAKRKPQRCLIIQTLPTIYEIGEADGMNFIAMEFIDGLPHSECDLSRLSTGGKL